jgi:hypothetical protein
MLVVKSPLTAFICISLLLSLHFSLLTYGTPLLQIIILQKPFIYMCEILRPWLDIENHCQNLENRLLQDTILVYCTITMTLFVFVTFLHLCLREKCISRERRRHHDLVLNQLAQSVSVNPSDDQEKTVLLQESTLPDMQIIPLDDTSQSWLSQCLILLGELLLLVLLLHSWWCLVVLLWTFFKWPKIQSGLHYFLYASAFESMALWIASLVLHRCCPNLRRILRLSVYAIALIAAPIVAVIHDHPFDDRVDLNIRLCSYGIASFSVCVAFHFTLRSTVQAHTLRYSVCVRSMDHFIICLLTVYFLMYGIPWSIFMSLCCFLQRKRPAALCRLGRIL